MCLAGADKIATTAFAGFTTYQLPRAPVDTLWGKDHDASNHERRGAIMDVVVWLRGLGLEEYEAAFRDNKINEQVLPNLTQEDLREIGVGPVGHRRILLNAIAALRTDATGEAPLVDAATTSSTQAHIPKTAPNVAK
jgi:SAM domain (Sterile alpha motif)